MQDIKIYEKEILSFLRTHPLISINALEQLVGIYPRDLQKALNERRGIPEKYIWPLLLALSGYGISINSYFCKTSASGDLKFWKKWRDLGKTEYTKEGVINKVGYEIEELRLTAKCLEDLSKLYTEKP